jgi:hypothetical protein
MTVYFEPIVGLTLSHADNFKYAHSTDFIAANLVLKSRQW